ncbi:unnamed protein product [Diamesa serratosioi]
MLRKFIVIGFVILLSFNNVMSEPQTRNSYDGQAQATGRFFDLSSLLGGGRYPYRPNYGGGYPGYGGSYPGYGGAGGYPGGGGGYPGGAGGYPGGAGGYPGGGYGTNFIGNGGYGGFGGNGGLTSYYGYDNNNNYRGGGNLGYGYYNSYVRPQITTNGYRGYS